MKQHWKKKRKMEKRCRYKERKRAKIEAKKGKKKVCRIAWTPMTPAGPPWLRNLQIAPSEHIARPIPETIEDRGVGAGWEAGVQEAAKKGLSAPTRRMCLVSAAVEGIGFMKLRPSSAVCDLHPRGLRRLIE